MIRAHGRDGGYSLVELLVSTALMVTITGAIFALVTPSKMTTQSQPEVADLQQRSRVGTEVLFKELMMAGAGPYQGEKGGTLLQYFAPIVPRRFGNLADPPTTFRSDAITLSYIPNSYSQTTISNPMPPNSSELKVNDQSNCPRHDGLCGFEVGKDVVVLDGSGSGSYDTFTITEVQGPAAHLQHRGSDLNYDYPVNSQVIEIRSYTYYFDPAAHQLMQHDGYHAPVPLVDDVVGLRFDYSGDPNPPRMPMPATTGVSNCVVDAAHEPILPTLTADDGSLAALPGPMLVDGPWCGSGDNRFDADLLRIRKVRVTLRVQVAMEGLRGTNPPDRILFMNPGVQGASARVVPDYIVSFEVSPRNLNFGR